MKNILFMLQGNVLQLVRYVVRWQETRTEIVKEEGKEPSWNKTPEEQEIVGEFERSVTSAEELEELTAMLSAREIAYTVEDVDVSEYVQFEGQKAESYDVALALMNGTYMPQKSVEQLQADVDYIAIMTGVDL